MIQVDIITLFPELVAAYASAGILRRAQAAGLATVTGHDLRPFGVGRHRITDEPPFGGGGGMVLRPDPIFAAVEALAPAPACPIILLSPQGRRFDQRIAATLAQQPRLIMICGRYEGFDERVRQHLATDEISLGDFVLTGGELAALAVADAVIRLQPGALGADGAAAHDSHATGLLEGPHYTKPAVFGGWSVPEVLRSGHGGEIARWRREGALARTWARRPELLLTAPLTEADRYYMAELARQRTAALREAAAGSAAAISAATTGQPGGVA